MLGNPAGCSTEKRAKTYMTGRRRAEATPFFERLCPAMTSSTEDRCRSERNVVVHVAIATPATAASRRDTARRRTAEIVAGLIRETPARARAAAAVEHGEV